ncbi:MAG: Rdx family protein [Proteobacteria bacterium]|nr:Rdx family protein [Pseudomonadota bacterium]
MADILKQKLGYLPKLIPGSNGVYDIVADGRLVFSKHQENRFPENDEIIRSLKQITK